MARDELAARCESVLCPVEQLTKRRKIPNRNRYRTETVVSPVFGRYLFACGAVEQVLSARGVADVVRSGCEALMVADAVITKLQLLTRFVDGIGDLMSARDLTRLSLGFKGAEGDTFKFAGGPMHGFLGVISSLARLDDRGEVKAYVDMLGSRHEVVVSHKDVGDIVKQASSCVEAVAA